MRTIKFRGKRLDGGGWVEGDLIRHYENQRRFIALDQMAYTYTENGISRLVSERYHEVLPESVGQWTGLVDKNGMEIYEGDIIRFTRKTGPVYRRTISSDVCAAKWIDEKSSFRLCYRTQRQKFSSHCSNKYEIIGNEFDSPELMEVE